MYIYICIYKSLWTKFLKNDFAESQLLDKQLFWNQENSWENLWRNLYAKNLFCKYEKIVFLYKYVKSSTYRKIKYMRFLPLTVKMGQWFYVLINSMILKIYENWKTFFCIFYKLFMSRWRIIIAPFLNTALPILVQPFSL